MNSKKVALRWLQRVVDQHGADDAEGFLFRVGAAIRSGARLDAFSWLVIEYAGGGVPVVSVWSRDSEGGDSVDAVLPWLGAGEDMICSVTVFAPNQYDAAEWTEAMRKLFAAYADGVAFEESV